MQLLLTFQPLPIPTSFGCLLGIGVSYKEVMYYPLNHTTCSFQSILQHPPKTKMKSKHQQATHTHPGAARPVNSHRQNGSIPQAQRPLSLPLIRRATSPSRDPQRLLRLQSSRAGVIYVHADESLGELQDESHRTRQASQFQYPSRLPRRSSYSRSL